MSAATAVGVYDDLAAGQTTVAMRATSEEATGWVDVAADALAGELGTRPRPANVRITPQQVRPFFLQRRQDQLFDQLLAGVVGEVVLAALLDHDAFVVLRREDHGMNAVGGAVGQVFDRHLALG